MARDLTTEPLGRPSKLPKMSYEEFLAWADEDTYAEWVDGEVHLMSPASNRHQDLTDFFTALLRHVCEATGAGVVRSAPFQMKTGARLAGREPDVVFISAQHLHRLTNTHVKGPADLVIEIVSDESRARDTVTKRSEYERGGVCEYWIVDPILKHTEFLQLGEDGAYHPGVTEAGIYRSAVLPDIWLRVDWLWQEKLPPLLDVLRQWGIL